MLGIVTLFTLLPVLYTQSAATLTQPPLIQTNTYTLRKTSLNITSPTTNITYMQTYTNAPQVFLSIVSMNSFKANSVVSYSMTVPTVTNSQFTVQYSISCVALGVSCSFHNIVIDYLAFDFSTYSFVQMLQESFLIDPAALTSNQYYEVNYMQTLTYEHSYSLNCILSGFTGMTITGKPSLYISAIENDRNSYYLGVKFENMLLVSFNYLRILIDETMMNAASTGPSSLTCSIGTIVHYADPNAVERNPSPDFLPFAVFFGVNGFSGYDISLTNLTYIFNNTTPRMSANIGYILFLTSSCPSNQLYVTSQNLCYSLSSAFYYQATPATMQPCPYSCYQCVGPLTTQCRSCVQGWNRVLSAGRCVCITGFYDPGAPMCKNCTEAIAGCKTCSSATNCLTCLSGCTAIGFSPIYCDCPNNIQTNYSYNCPASYYFDYTTNVCTCLPQTYYNAGSNMCYPCATGCYLCARNATYCLACINSYRLVDNTCVYYYMSYALLGQEGNFNNPQIRCLRWDQSSGTCIQRCKHYFYEGNCYSKCPMGTFNISFPWLTCQPCQKSCNYCFNYTICYQCSTTYYYFNSSILSCSHCPDHCLKCTSASSCTLCEDYYELSNGNSSCLLPSIPSVSCDDNCNYCLLPHQCLTCMMGYYLNKSSHICLACDANMGLQLQSDGCQEVCGDGKLINQECDDGNRITGDGCSVNCQIQLGFQCRQIQGVSRCWGRSVAVDWLIFSVFGRNSVIMSMESTFPLGNVIMDLKCGFKSTFTRASHEGREQLTITYQESFVMMGMYDRASTLQYYSGNLTKNLCQITFNQLHIITFPIHADPTPFLVDYGSPLQSISQNKAIRMGNRISVYFTLATLVLGLSPMTSYASFRFLMLYLVTFGEYMHVPINSFAPYESLQGALFVTPSTTTRELSHFSSEYYIAVLWHLVVAYIAVAVWLEVIVPFFMRMGKGMEWGMMTRMAAVLAENKPIAYQNMYIGYEVAIWCLLGKVFANIHQASSTLMFLTVLHLIFSVASKIHFFFTFDQLKKTHPQFTHTLVVEQIQNICIAMASATTTDKSSYTPILMSLFGVYSLLSLGRNIPQQPKEDSFHITVQMTIWQIRIGYLCQLLVQCLKMAFMWCGHLLTDSGEYETVGEAVGLAISLLISLFISMGALNSFLVHLIKVCQIKNQGRATIPSIENLDAQTADGNSHSD